MPPPTAPTAAECVTIPTPLDEFSDIFAGGSITGLLCFVVPENRTTLTLFVATGVGSVPIMHATD